MSYQRIVEYGTYYFPAWKHYGDSSSDVVCDKCLRHNLSACIGYGDQDLCLRCADQVTEACVSHHTCRCGKHSCGSCYTRHTAQPIRIQPYIEPYVIPIPIPTPMIPPMMPPMFEPMMHPTCEPSLSDMCDKIIMVKRQDDNCS